MIFERFKSLLTRIANAIRKQGGFTDLIPAEQLDIAIESLVVNDENLKGVIAGTIVGPLNLKYSGLQFRDYTFANCSNLENIILPDGITKIPQYAFYNCLALKEISIPDSVTEIGAESFNGCSGIKSVVIPDSVTKIGSGAFRKCTSLEEIHIPKNAVLGAYSFAINVSENCKIYFAGTIDEYVQKSWTGEITLITNDNCLLYLLNNDNEYYQLENLNELTGSLISQYAFHNYDYFSEHLSIPDSVTEIGKYAFSGCRSIKSVVIPDSVTKINDNAFTSCDSLENVTIGEGISYLGNYVFNYCFYTLKMVEIKATTPPTLKSSVFNGSYPIYVPKGTRDTYISATNWSALASRIIEPNTITLSIPTTLLNNANYIYSVDNGETWNQFASELFAVENVTAIKFKSLDANTTILIGTSEGGSDVGTIANAELLYPTSGDATIYLTIQA